MNVLPTVVKRKIIKHLAEDRIVNSNYWAKTPVEMLAQIRTINPSADELTYILFQNMEDAIRWEIITSLMDRNYAFTDDHITILLTSLLPGLLSLFLQRLTTRLSPNNVLDIMLMLPRSSNMPVEYVPPNAKVIYYAKRFATRHMVPGDHDDASAAWFLLTMPGGGHVSGHFGTFICFFQALFRTRNYPTLLRNNIEHVHRSNQMITYALLRADPSQIENIWAVCADAGIRLALEQEQIGELRRSLTSSQIDVVTSQALQREGPAVTWETLVICDPDAVCDIFELHFPPDHVDFEFGQRIAVIRATGLRKFREPLRSMATVELYLTAAYYFAPDALTSEQYDNLGGLWLNLCAFVKCPRLYIIRPIPEAFRFHIMVSMTFDQIDGYFALHNQVPTVAELDLWLNGVDPMRIFAPQFEAWRRLMVAEDYFYLFLKCSNDQVAPFFYALAELGLVTQPIIRVALSRLGSGINLTGWELDGANTSMLLAIQTREKGAFAAQDPMVSRLGKI